jgi:hypothetical protein
VHLQQGRSKLGTILGHALVNLDYVVVCGREAALAVVWLAEAMLSGSAHFLEALRIALLKRCSLLEEGSEFLLPPG